MKFLQKDSKFCTNSQYLRFLTCHYFNARSLSNKLNSLTLLLNSEKYDIIFITETWLSDNIFDSEIIKNSNYSIFRRDRLYRHGGGVAILFRNVIKINMINIPVIYNASEILVADMSTPSLSYRFIVSYRPPNSDNEYNELFLQSLTWATTGVLVIILLFL